MTQSLKQIEDFLDGQRIAVVGVSHDPRDFTRTMFRELLSRGYDAVPVNPGVTEVEGRPCFPSVTKVPAPVDGVLVMTKPAVTEAVARECADAGIRRLWMYRATGTGAVSVPAVAFCREKGIDVIAGECPFMFLPKAGIPHRVHGFCRKLLGRYPA
jgi:predicted CoA-binding protein